MTYKKITLGFNKTWVDGTNTPPKIKQWADINIPNNYTIDWYDGEDHDIVFNLTAKNVSEKIVSFAVLSLQGMKLLETENYETHPDAKHLFDFGDD
jgi:hypothetical protein